MDTLHEFSDQLVYPLKIRPDCPDTRIHRQSCSGFTLWIVTKRIRSMHFYVCLDAGAGNVMDQLCLHPDGSHLLDQALKFNPRTHLSIDLDG